MPLGVAGIHCVTMRMEENQSVSVLPRVLLALVAAAMLSTPALPAFAHNVVEALSPEEGSVVTESPLAISIATDDTFLDLGGESRGFAIAVRDGEGLYYGDGCVTVDERRMETLVDLGPPGPYTIVYQFVSSDGHSLSESYGVTFDPSASHTPSVGYSTPPECGTERTGADEPGTGEPRGDALSTEEKTAAAQPTLELSTETEPMNGWAISIGFAVSLGILAFFALAARKKSRKPNQQ